MAHTTERLEAKRLYVEEGNTVKEISQLTGVNEKTLYRWSKADGWDQDRETIALTGASAYKNMLLLAVRKLEEMVKVGEIDPRQADALQKVVKAARSLSKDIDKRGNILLGMGEFVDFLRENHPDALTGIQPYLGEFGSWVKRKYP